MRYLSKNQPEIMSCGTRKQKVLWNPTYTYTRTRTRTGTRAHTPMRLRMHCFQQIIHTANDITVNCHTFTSETTVILHVCCILVIAIS